MRTALGDIPCRIAWCGHTNGTATGSGCGGCARPHTRNACRSGTCSRGALGRGDSELRRAVCELGLDDRTTAVRDDAAQASEQVLVARHLAQLHGRDAFAGRSDQAGCLRLHQQTKMCPAHRRTSGDTELFVCGSPHSSEPALSGAPTRGPRAQGAGIWDVGDNAASRWAWHAPHCPAWRPSSVRSHEIPPDMSSG